MRHNAVLILIYNFCSHFCSHSAFINNKLFVKILQYYVKTHFQICFEFFKKTSFIKKSVEKYKNKECKKRYFKKSQLQKFFQVCISIVYDGFILELSICYCGDKVKYQIR